MEFIVSIFSIFYCYSCMYIQKHTPVICFVCIFYWLCYYNCPIFFSPLSLSARYPHSLQHSSSLSSCPWVVHTSSLASPFPILFLTSPCLSSTYNLCYLFSVPFPLSVPSPFSSDNHLCDLHFHDSVPVLFVCLVCFCFGFRCGC